MKDTMMLSRGHFPDNLLHKLKHLELYSGDSSEARATMPFGFFQKVPNLERFSIRHFFALREIFPNQRPEGIDYIINVLAQMRALFLYWLPLLSSIGLHNSWLDPLCKNLEVLKVNGCPRLTILAPSSGVSFCNLKELTIRRCDGLVSLFQCSIAKSLVQLEKMTVSRCTLIEQIVTPEPDESTSNEIIFDKLVGLSLCYLARLASFYSGNGATLQFSVLKDAEIVQCPRMKFLSRSRKGTQL